MRFSLTSATSALLCLLPLFADPAAAQSSAAANCDAQERMNILRYGLEALHLQPASAARAGLQKLPFSAGASIYADFDGLIEIQGGQTRRSTINFLLLVYNVFNNLVINNIHNVDDQTTFFNFTNDITLLHLLPLPAKATFNGLGSFILETCELNLISIDGELPSSLLGMDTTFLDIGNDEPGPYDPSVWGGNSTAGPPPLH